MSEQNPRTPAVRPSSAATPFLSLRREMDRFFDDMWSNFGALPALGGGSRAGGSFLPSVDLSETDAGITVSAELPGMEEGDIDVSLSGDVLTIKGEKKEEQKEEREDFYRVERSYGSFTRAIPLPAEVDPSKVEATFKNGVLKVSMTKKEGSASHRIEVKNG